MIDNDLMTEFLAEVMTDFADRIRAKKMCPMEATLAFTMLLRSAVDAGIIRLSDEYSLEQKSRMPFFSEKHREFFLHQKLFVDSIGETDGNA